MAYREYMKGKLAKADGPIPVMLFCSRYSWPRKVDDGSVVENDDDETYEI